MPTRPIEGIVRLSDCLIGNERELAAWAGPRPRLTVVKRATGVEVPGHGFFPHDPLPAAEIRDATGAGDVFAAGFLAVLARDPHRIAAAVTLGVRPARHKLRHLGDAGHTGFAELAANVLTR